MTISSSTRTAGPFLGDGSTTALPFGFKVFATTDVLVQRTSADGAQLALTLGGDYTVALNADQNAAPGGVVTLLDPAADFPTGSSITLTSAVAATQPLSLANGGPFLAKSIEDALDRLTLLLQQQALSLDGAVRAPLVETLTELPAATARRGKMMAFDPSTGDLVLPSFTITQVANAVAAAYASGLVLPFINVLDYGAVGDGTTDDTAAFTLAVAAVNTVGGKLILPPGQYVVAAGTIDITYNGVQIVGVSKGDAAYPTPTYPAATAIFITGTGPGIRIRSQSVTLSDFRLSSDAVRAALPFDLQSPGVRVEAPDTSANDRADRCVIHDFRIDKQPGDGYLSVGPAIYADLARIDIYECKGFGFRFDPGLLTGLVRTYPLYPGLSVVHSSRVGYCGGHSIACSNNDVVSQTYMAIRMQIIDLDSFGNGQNTSIMYPSADGQFYDFWIFGENCLVQHSAPCGRVGNMLVPELMGGIWIGGRDNRIINNRFIDTQQPIYWGYKAAQPSTGLEVNTFRLVNTSLTHTNMVKVQSASARGLRVIYDRRDSMVSVVPDSVGGTPLPSYVLYQGGIEKVSSLSVDLLSSITNTGTLVELLDDAVFELPINGTGSGISIQGVLVFAPTSVTHGGGMFHLRLNATSPVATKWAGETLCVAHGAGGALTGTTGVDGQVTVSCSNTTVYIENRAGFTIRFTYQLLAFSSDTSI